MAAPTDQPVSALIVAHEHRERVVEDAPADDLGDAQRGERAAPGVHPRHPGPRPRGGQPVIDADFLAPSASVDAAWHAQRAHTPHPVVGVRAGRGVRSGRGRSPGHPAVPPPALVELHEPARALTRRGAGGARAPGGGRARPSTTPRPCSRRGARSSRPCSRSRPPAATRTSRGEGRPGLVTYSPKVFVPLTRLCRDRCHYCTFATVPGRLPGGLPRARRGPRDRPRGRRAGLHRGAVHPRRPPRGPLGGGPGLAGRTEPHLHARPRLRECGSGPRRDRTAAAPQPRRHGPPSSSSGCGRCRRRWG